MFFSRDTVARFEPSTLLLICLLLYQLLFFNKMATLTQYKEGTMDSNCESDISLRVGKLIGNLEPLYDKRGTN